MPVGKRGAALSKLDLLDLETLAELSERLRAGSAEEGANVGGLSSKAGVCTADVGTSAKLAGGRGGRKPPDMAVGFPCWEERGRGRGGVWVQEQTLAARGRKVS